MAANAMKCPACGKGECRPAPAPLLCDACGEEWTDEAAAVTVDRWRADLLARAKTAEARAAESERLREEAEAALGPVQSDLDESERERLEAIRERDTERRLREEAERQLNLTRGAMEINKRAADRFESALTAERERAGALERALLDALNTGVFRDGRPYQVYKAGRALLAPTPPPASAETTRRCNRHKDCDAADREQRAIVGHGADHCPGPNCGPACPHPPASAATGQETEK